MQDCTLPDLFKVLDNKKETDDIFTLTLTPDSGNLPNILPGQFNMLSAFGIGESPIGLSQVQFDNNILYHTVRAVGPVTKSLKQLQKGDTLPIRGPFGTTWPTDEIKGKSVIVIAGGMGLCPLRPLIQYLITNKADFTDINVIYGARSPSDIIYQDDLNNWENELNLLITVDIANAPWQHHVGVVTPLIPLVINDPENTVALICGPEIMMRFSIYSLMEEGILDENIYLSMERNMQCGTGHCGHCQWGRYFICKDGPVMRYDQIKDQFVKSEL